MDKEISDLEKCIDTLDDFVPAIPDEVVKSLIAKAGCLGDKEVIRSISFLTQKFIYDVIQESYANAKYKKYKKKSKSKTTSSVKRKKIILSNEVLSETLSDRGIKVVKPPYYCDDTNESFTSFTQSHSSST